MNELANDLNNLIDKFGFGVEFTKEDLFSYFESEEEADFKIKSLIENDLLNQDILSNNYYIADIFTCNNFLSEYLIQKEETVKEDDPLSYSKTDDIITIKGLIKPNKLMKILTKFESNIEDLDLKRENKKFRIILNLKFNESIEVFKEKLN